MSLNSAESKALELAVSALRMSDRNRLLISVEMGGPNNGLWIFAYKPGVIGPFDHRGVFLDDEGSLRGLAEIECWLGELTETRECAE